MKNFIKANWMSLILITFITIILSGLAVFAQVAPSPTPMPSGPTLQVQLPAWVSGLLAKAPAWISTVLMIVGALRIIMKPIFALSHQFFQQMGLTSWDQKTTAVEQSKFMKAIYFAIDWLSSVKLPVKAQDPSIKIEEKAS